MKLTLPQFIFLLVRIVTYAGVGYIARKYDRHDLSITVLAFFLSILIIEAWVKVYYKMKDEDKIDPWNLKDNY